MFPLAQLTLFSLEIQAYEEALEIYRTLVEANPAAYRPGVATTLNNLGNLHREEHRYAEARQAYEEALRIYEELAAATSERFAANLKRLRDLIVPLPKMPTRRLRRYADILGLSIKWFTTRILRRD
jgi:tetratricopeptide (TPR) repeat protein